MKEGFFYKHIPMQSSYRYIVCLLLTAVIWGCGTTNITVSGSILTSGAVSTNLSKGSFLKAVTTTNVPAAGYTVYCYNYITGEACGEGVTDNNGQFEITGVPQADLTDPNDPATVRLWIRAVSPSGQYEIINFIELTTDEVAATKTISTSADPNTTIAAEAILEQCKEYDGGYTIGTPLPSALTTAIAAQTFDPKCYVDAHKNYLQVADINESGLKGAMGAIQSMINCMMATEISPETCSNADNTADIVGLFMRGSADENLISCLANQVLSACGIDSASFITNATTATQMLAGIRGITATQFASDQTLCQDIKGETETAENVNTALREMVLSFENEAEMTSVFASGNPVRSFIDLAKTDNDFTIFTTKPRALIGILESGLSNTVYDEAYAVLREWNPESDISGDQMKDWGYAMNQMLKIADSDDIIQHASTYCSYMEDNIVMAGADVNEINYISLHNDLSGAIGLYGEDADQYIPLLLQYENYKMDTTEEITQYQEQLQQQQYSPPPEEQEDYYENYENNDYYALMCLHYLLHIGGYDAYYQQYCGAKPLAPSSVVANAGNSQVTINWTAVSGASSYKIYWATATGVTSSNGTAISNITSTSYTHTGRTNGTAYYYVMTAVSSHGESVASSEVSATPQAPTPGVPANVTAVAGDAQVTISWTSVDTAISYNLYFGVSSNVSKVTGTKISSVTSPYIHTGRTNNTTYYYCVTAVNPGGESNCSLVAGATPQAALSLWTKTWNNSDLNSNDVGRGVAVDSSGNVYVAGDFFADYVEADDWTFLDIWLRKYNASGGTVWTKTYNQSDGYTDEYGYAVAVDSSGNVYVAGSQTDESLIADGVVIKYDSSGNVTWTATYSGTANDNDEALGIAVDSSGNVYVAGYEMTAGSGNDIWVSKLDSGGDTTWTKKYSGAAGDDDRGASIAVDSYGNVYAAGYETVTDQSTNVWVRKYDSSGNVTWTKTYNSDTNGGDLANGITVDSSGNVYVTGSAAITAGSTDVWVRKYDSDGDTVWTQTYDGGVGSDIGYAIAVDSSGNVYATGSTSVTNQKTDVWVRKYDSDGDTVWTQTYNNPILNSWEVGFGIAVSSNGGVYVTGDTYITGQGADIWTRIYSAEDGSFSE